MVRLKMAEEQKACRTYLEDGGFASGFVIFA